MSLILDWKILERRVAHADVFTWKGGSLASVTVAWSVRKTWMIQVTTRGCCHDVIDVDCGIPCPERDEAFPVAVLEKAEEKLRDVGLIKAPRPHLDWTAEDNFRRAVVLSAKGHELLTANLRYSPARSGWCASLGAPGVSLLEKVISQEPDADVPPPSVRLAAEAWLVELGVLRSHCA